jgi:hypothetical protein
MKLELSVDVVKVKVKLSLCFSEHDAMEAHWGVEV